MRLRYRFAKARHSPDWLEQLPNRYYHPNVRPSAGVQFFDGPRQVSSRCRPLRSLSTIWRHSNDLLLTISWAIAESYVFAAFIGESLHLYHRSYPWGWMYIWRPGYDRRLSSYHHLISTGAHYAFHSIYFKRDSILNDLPELSLAWAVWLRCDTRLYIPHIFCSQSIVTIRDPTIFNL